MGEKINDVHAGDIRYAIKLRLGGANHEVLGHCHSGNREKIWRVRMKTFEDVVGTPEGDRILKETAFKLGIID